jgi:hypothetical protein
VRERFVSQRTGIINQIRAFMLERGIAVRQGPRFLCRVAWHSRLALRVIKAWRWTGASLMSA